MLAPALGIGDLTPEVLMQEAVAVEPGEAVVGGDVGGWGEKSIRSEGLHSRLRNPSFWFNVERRNEMISLRFLKSSFLFGLPESRKRHHDAKEDKVIDPADPSTSRLFKYAFWFDVSVIISFAALYLIYEISKTEEGPAFVLLALICTAIVFVSNCAVPSCIASMRLAR